MLFLFKPLVIWSGSFNMLQLFEMSSCCCDIYLSCSRCYYWERKCQWAITQPINHTNTLLMSVSEIINNTLVFFVKESKNAVKLLPLISICFEYPSFLHSKKMSERDHCMAICASVFIFLSNLVQRLNCFIILLIFSNRCASGWWIDAEFAITRNVVFSNSTISSAPQMEQNVSKLACNSFMLGIKQWIILAQACN